MSRTSKVHYIAPSAVAITPNANDSQNDLAVYVARGAKIKVYSPKAGIDLVNAMFQEWSLTGRNRRLSDSEKPYTIYARLSKTDRTNGYILFVPKVAHGSDWVDRYSCVTTEGLSVLYQEGGVDVVVDDPTYWYIRLGDVSLPDNGLRTITLFDTGILGTDQYNEEWNFEPDNLPLRLELGCTIDDEDAGQTPYVYWGGSAVLTASLVEGWTNTEVERFAHWSIERNTGNAEADEAWNHPNGESSYRGMADGSITLLHARNVADDDFNGAVAATFKVTAWVTEENDGVQSVVPMLMATITIFAETLEKYELGLSESIVSFNPRSGEYAPSTGVDVRVRAIDQRGVTFDLTRGQFSNARLSVEYAPVESESWTTLDFTGTSAEMAVAVIPVSAFANHKSLNVRLMRIIDLDSESSDSSDDDAAAMELSRTTIAFVRDGEDSKEREWIYRLNSTVGYDNTTANRNKQFQDDDFVPVGWTDDPVGVSAPGDTEYTSWRDFDLNTGQWGAFHEPRIWSRNGDDAVTYDIVTSESIINADADGVIISDGIVVRAYRTEGTARSGNILPEDSIPDQGDYYFAEYSIDGGEWARCGIFPLPSDSSDDSDFVNRYGIGYTIVETAEEGIAFRLKHSSDTDAILKEIAPIKVVRNSDLNNLATGHENLLRNSGFTGEFVSEELSWNTQLYEDTPVFSNPLAFWTATHTEVIDTTDSVTGKAAQLDNGSLLQTLETNLEEGKSYIFSFLGNGTQIKFSVAGYSQTITLTASNTRYNIKFKAVESGNMFAITDTTGTIMELQLIEGNVPNNGWIKNAKDNDKTLAEFLGLLYLTNAIREADVEKLGGLILSAMVWVGNYINGRQQNTGGMSGLYTDGNSPFLWGGGTFEQAIETIMYYASRRPEHYYDEEPEGHVNFAVTHGGRAILNDMIVRGWIYAIGGVFKNIHSPNNSFVIDELGNVTLKGRIESSEGKIGGWKLSTDGFLSERLTDKDDAIEIWRDVEHPTSMAYLDESTLLLQDAWAYTDNSYTATKIGIGQYSDPTPTKNIHEINEYHEKGSALYIYRRTFPTQDDVIDYYYPAATIISDNAGMPDVALHLGGALRVTGGVMEYGVVRVYGDDSKPDGAVLIDLSVGTTYTYHAGWTDGDDMEVNIPNLSHVKDQLGIKSNDTTTTFCVPLTIVNSSMSVKRVRIFMQKDENQNRAHIRDNNGGYWSDVSSPYDNIELVKGDSVELLITYLGGTMSDNYYAQVLRKND